MLLVIGFLFFVLIDEEVGDDEGAEDYAGDAVGGHEGDVYFTEVVGLYNGVLVVEHADEDCYAYPVEPVKTTIDACYYYTSCA